MSNPQANIRQGQSAEPVIYQGQFGEFTITASDRQGVLLYRASLIIAALSFAVGTALFLGQEHQPFVWATLSFLYGLFSLALAVSLFTIHIYMIELHRLLQLFWVIGTIAAIACAATNPQPLALTVGENSMTILGIGFTFAALTGIYFKEAFCFNRLETKLLTPLVPLLLIGFMTGILPTVGEKILLALWAILFVVFAARKAVQPIAADVGDKSVFVYLKQQRAR